VSQFKACRNDGKKQQYGLQFNENHNK